MAEDITKKYRAVVLVPHYLYVDATSIKTANAILSVQLANAPNDTHLPYRLHSVEEASRAVERPGIGLKGVP